MDCLTTLTAVIRPDILTIKILGVSQHIVQYFLFFKTVYMNNNQHKTENSLLHYDYSTSCIANNEYVLTYNNKYYKVGEFMYQILHEGKKVNYLEDLLSCFNNKTDITVASLKEIIETSILPVFRLPPKIEKDHSDAFWMKKQILASQHTISFAKPIAFLFGKLFYPLFLILAGFNIWLYYQTNQSNANFSGSQGYELIAWVITYLAFFIIIFVHELGHAAAAIKSGINPRGIGLGFYTIMPAMFTDLTDIWKLNKAKKIKVNLGGIFIQLIINIGLIIAIQYSKKYFILSIVWKLYFVNCFTMVMNLIPFLKFDGYWVLSDFIGMPNLLKESSKLLVDAVTKKDPFGEEDKFKRSTFHQTFLLIYSILRILFVLVFVFFVFAFIYTSLQKTIILIKYLPYLKFNLETSIELLKRVATITIIFLFTKKYKKMFSSIIFKKAPWYKV